MEIKSTQNKLIKDLRKLSQKKYRDQSDIILVEGEHLVEEAKAANLLKETLGLVNADITISDEVAKSLSETKSGSNIFGIVNKPKYELSKASRYLILDNVQDPGNVGTLIRSAYSFGFDFCILSNDSADEFNDKVIRASQGAIFHFPVIRMDLKDLYTTLKDYGVKIYATHVSDDSNTLDRLNLANDIAVVMGSEGSGVSEYSLNTSDAYLHIPTSRFESLNVAVAGGIICYYLKK